MKKKLTKAQKERNETIQVLKIACRQLYASYEVTGGEEGGVGLGAAQIVKCEIEKLTGREFNPYR